MKPPSLPPRYTVRSLLGEGGSGRVYRVHDAIRDLDLALKLVTPAESAWLRREFDTLRQIRHENLIRVYDWGALVSGEAYYTMELVDGEDWGSRMGAPQTAEEVRRILTGLLRGLAHLHCHGEIHGDLKPGNILLGRGGVVKVTDVGMGGSGREASGLSGTPGYAAPEVWEGAPADARSDLYSVGVMAYEALSGHHPFGGRTVREVVSGQLEGWVPSPGAHGVNAPADLERVLMRAVERSPALRHGSADEFMEGMSVEDRIGEILGGKFVGREEELSAIGQLLENKSPDGPTIVRIVGPPGIGKSALLEEAAERARASGAAVIDLTSARGREMAAIAASIEAASSKGTDAREAGDVVAPRLGSLAEKIWARGEIAPLLIWTDADLSLQTKSDSSLAPLARYLWALSVERGRRAKFLCAIGSVEATETAQAFEQRLRLAPIDVDGVLGIIEGVTGRVKVEPSTLERIHAVTGGNPGLILRLLAELRERSNLTRSDGIWTLREEERLDSLKLASVSSLLGHAWGRLGGDVRVTLLRCALLGRGLDEAAFATPGVGNQLRDHLAVLVSRGWVVSHDGRWQVSSEAVRAVALERSASDLIREVAGDCLSRLRELLDPEERGDLALRSEETERSFELGMEAARLAVRRADHHAAMRRLRGLVDLAMRLGRVDRAREASMMLAEALHSLGNDAQALEVLTNSIVWGIAAGEDLSTGEHELLLGKILMTQGETNQARDQLGRAIEIAHERGIRSLWLRGHAELAQIDLELGTAEDRAAAIVRIRGVLDEAGDDESLNDERAALTYGLGATLITAGDRSQARDLLLIGIQTQCSDYWKMRIANALGSAFRYLGEFDSALEWADSALRYAEEAGADSFKPRLLGNRGAKLHAIGRFKESAEDDLQSANWAQRLGNPFEYAAGLVGAAANSIRLARYEDAIEEASKARLAAEGSRDSRFLGKALELEGLAHFYIGTLDMAEASARRAAHALRHEEYVETRPRVDWLIANIYLAQGEFRRGVDLLRTAERSLREKGDLEDLWGVQIELHRALAREGGSQAHLRAISDIIRDASRRRALFEEVSGAIAIGEIVAEAGVEYHEFREVMSHALACAERSGMLEGGWQLSFRIGQFALCKGDGRETRAGYAHATRILREIAARLTPQHRDSYLGISHIRSAMTVMSEMR